MKILFGLVLAALTLTACGGGQGASIPKIALEACQFEGSTTACYFNVSCATQANTPQAGEFGCSESFAIPTLLAPPACAPIAGGGPVFSVTFNGTTATATLFGNAPGQQLDLPVNCT